MKTEKEIKKQLEEVYEHRLRLRIDRKTKCTCRNCVDGMEKEFDLGDFGIVTRWECREGRTCGDGCGFSCRYNAHDIEEEMTADISDPSVCGAKEPKIAVLLWMLHDDVSGQSENSTFWEKIKRVFNG